MYLTYSALAVALAGVFVSAYLIVNTRVKERADQVTRELQNHLMERIRRLQRNRSENDLRDIIRQATDVGRPKYYVARCCKSLWIAGMLMLSTAGLCLLLEGLDNSIRVLEVDVLLGSLRAVFAFAISTGILGFIYLNKFFSFVATSTC